MAKMTIQQVYSQIDEQRRILIVLLNRSTNTPVAPNLLSDVCMKLAILNELLGGFVVDLKYAQLEAEKVAFQIAKDEGASDTGATQTARLQTSKERHAYEKASVKHKDLWSLISMAQSHIRAENEERRGM